MILFTLIARIVVLFGLPLTLFSIPYFVFAAPLVPSCSGTECGFDDLIVLVRNTINFLLIITAPIAAIMFAYAGFLYLTAAGDSGKISKAHGIFWTVLCGIVITLAAWLIISTITGALLKEGYSLLG